MPLNNHPYSYNNMYMKKLAYAEFVAYIVGNFLKCMGTYRSSNNYNHVHAKIHSTYNHAYWISLFNMKIK